jgi:hypothetical protein
VLFLDTERVIINLVVPILTFLDLIFVVLLIFLSNRTNPVEASV